MTKYYNLMTLNSWINDFDLELITSTSSQWILFKKKKKMILYILYCANFFENIMSTMKFIVQKSFSYFRERNVPLLT